MEMQSNIISRHVLISYRKDALVTGILTSSAALDEKIQMSIQLGNDLLLNQSAALQGQATILAGTAVIGEV